EVRARGCCYGSRTSKVGHWHRSCRAELPSPLRHRRQGRSMPEKVRIALDAMGGDYGASVVVPGAEISLNRHPDIEVLLLGDAAQTERLLAERDTLRAAARTIHTDVAVRMDDKPSQALRRVRWKSWMWLAIDAVKRGEADVAVSAGNTGALMAMAKFHLRTMA